MRIQNRPRLVACPPHFGERLLRGRDTAHELRREAFPRRRFERVAARAGEVVHEARNLVRVAVVEHMQKALHIGALQDVHGRRVGDDELPLRRVDPRPHEPRQHVVHVRGDDERADVRAKFLRVVGREHVPEVPRRHDDVDGFAHPRGGEQEVGDLRHEATRVDGVRRREEDAALPRVRVEAFVREEPLDGRLRVVEVAVDADRVDVGRAGRRHLQTLDARDARGRVEDEDLRPLHAREALHRRRARVARRRRQHEDARIARRRFHEHGQHRQGDVLERARRAVEEFKEMERAVPRHGNRVFLGEAREQPLDGRRADGGREIVEERVHDERFGLAQRRHARGAREGREGFGDVKSAVGREPLENGFRARRREALPG